ncbi:MAG: ribosome-associated translation inhibitor RaiA [Pseudomonadota bacterium]
MQITVQGKQMDVGDSLRTHATSKINEILQKYFNRATDVTATLSPEGHGFVRAHISLHVGRQIMVQATAVESEAYAAFDAAMTKVAKQMRRYKQRLRSHHDRIAELPETDWIQAQDYTLANDERMDDEGDSSDDTSAGAEPLVIAEMTTAIQNMSVSEAVMRMDLAGQSALLFSNAKTGGLNMVYRRADGNIGWVDPASNASARQAAE